MCRYSRVVCEAAPGMTRSLENSLSRQETELAGNKKQKPIKRKKKTQVSFTICKSAFNLEDDRLRKMKRRKKCEKERKRIARACRLLICKKTFAHSRILSYRYKRLSILPLLSFSVTLFLREYSFLHGEWHRSRSFFFF